MRSLIRLVVVLAVIVLLLATATPVLANGGVCVVAPTIKGDEVKEPVTEVPDKSTGHPVFGENPAYGGVYGDPGAPGKVFWTESGSGF